MKASSIRSVRLNKYGVATNLRVAGGPIVLRWLKLNGTRWIDYADLKASCGEHGVPMVPHVFSGPLNMADAYAIAEEDSRWYGANHFSEGVVIVPVKERVDDKIGRVCLKIVSTRYLESGK